jgi:TolB-like protein/Tfp pilus assembly protein PilF
MLFFGELKRRGVFKVGALYIVSCWVVLQVASLLFAAFELPPAWVRAVLAILMLGFPVVVTLAWFYEITPEGLRRTSELDGSESRRYSAGHKLGILTGVLLVIAIALVAFERLMPDSLTEAVPAATETAASGESARPASTTRQRSIAVLPFANRSARDEDVFFTDGIHDDILTQLARIGSLTVISRTSVERFRKPTESIKEIGSILGVAHILEGSVQRAGDRIRVNVQLIEVSTDAHVWADIYDRELTTENIFAIQSEIATAVAGELKAALSPAEKAQLEDVPTQSLTALEAYFRGRQSMEERTSAALKDAERQFTRAIELDPDYALAYVGLADAHILQAYYGDASLIEQRALAKPWIEKALAINPQLGEAYISMTEVVDDPEAEEKLYKKGIDLAPGYSTGYQWYGEFLAGQGRHEEALEVFREGVRVDPLSNVARFTLGYALEGLGRFDDAGRVYESVVRDNPDFAVGHYLLGQFRWISEGRLDEAVISIGRAAAIDPDNSQFPAYLGALWSDLGDIQRAEYWSDTARSIPGSGSNANLAAFYMKIGRGDFAGASDDAEAILAENPEMPHALWTLALRDLQESRAESAVSRYGTVYPALRNEPAMDDTNYVAAVDLAYALRAIGEDERADRLLTGALEHLGDQPRLGNFGYGITDVRIYVMQGKPEQALETLRGAVDEGWRVFWKAYLLHDPVFDELRTNPEFEAIVAELEADMASQREHVRGQVQFSTRGVRPGPVSQKIEPDPISSFDG